LIKIREDDDEYEFEDIGLNEYEKTRYDELQLLKF
jgi:hypothetical protein